MIWPLAKWRAGACLLILLAGLLGACTRIQFEGTANRLDIAPQAAASMGASVIGSTVVWGGRILAIKNLEQSTELLVLGLPLSRGNMPLLERESIGRFVVTYPGFLEPVDYAPGRYLSLAGRIESLSETDWSGADPSPLPRVESGQLHLWPRDPSRWQPRFSIGVGVGISR